MPTSVPTNEEFTALTTHVASLETRVTKLETSTPIPPQPNTPSPSGTTLTSADGVIIDQALNKRTLRLSNVATDGLQITRNDQVDINTRNVAILLFFEGVISQKNVAGNWYSETAQYTWNQIPGDPRVKPPNPGPSASGYNPGSAKPTINGGSNSITATLNTLTGALAFQSMFGVAGASLAPGEPWNYRMLVDPAAVPAFKALGLKFVRVLGGTSMSDVFGSGTTPNWSFVDNLRQLPIVFPGAKFMLSLVYGWSGYNIGDANVRQTLANNYVAFARHFKDFGLNVDWWEPINEPDGANLAPGNVAELERVVRNALHGVDPTYKVGAACTTYQRGDYETPSAAAGAEFISWHSYDHPPGSWPGDQQIYDSAAAWWSQPTNAQNAARAGRQFDYPLYLTEYNLNFYSGNGNDDRQQGYQGAIFAALVMAGQIYGGGSGTTIWRLENDDGTYGVFKTHTWTVNPVGALITALNKYAPEGKVVRTTINSTGSDRMFALTIASDTKFAMIIINYHVSASWTGPVVVNDRTSTSKITRWWLNSAAALGSVDEVDMAPLLNLTVPPATVYILSGSKT